MNKECIPVLLDYPGVITNEHQTRHGMRQVLDHLPNLLIMIPTNR